MLSLVIEKLMWCNAAANKNSGCDAVFLRSFVEETKYECPKCTFVLRDPIQIIDWGHRFFKNCLEDMCKSFLSRFSFSF